MGGLCKVLVSKGPKGLASVLVGLHDGVLVVLVVWCDLVY